ncbi:MAG: DEAD/DEAH box helicase, partial [Clostridia bacterium]|nr:DEAD/DEAH box helicase [Clostridia bacterium]
MKGVKCLTDSVTSLSGVGAVRAAALEKLGIRTLRDLLYAFPRGYENRANIRTLAQGADGAKSAFLLTVGTAPRTVRLRGRLTLTKFRAFDETGTVEVVFYNQDYVRQIFTVGDTWRFWGTLNHSKTWTLSSPAYEKLELGKTLPDYISLYSLNSGITRKVMEGLVDSALSMDIQDFLPEEIRLRQGLPTLSYALRQVHHPESKEQLEKALRRLVFDELYCLSVGIAASRAQKSTPTTHAVPTPDLTPLLSLLPYELTGAQKRSIQEIFSDMAGKTGADGVPAMRRILIGDVGSGKTVCAMAALYAAAKAGGQAAIMAPTEILATQHYSEIAPLFSRLGIEVACLTGSTSQKEKNRIYARLSDPQNPLPVIIGTHALLGDKVHFSKLLGTIKLITTINIKANIIKGIPVKSNNSNKYIILLINTVPILV